MFVASNKLSAVKAYFRERLTPHFSTSEIKLMFNILAKERLDIENAYLLLNDTLLSESDLLYFRMVVKRLLTNEPFQQIIGFTEFFGLKITVSQAVLTPRPETEELVYEIVNRFKNKQAPTVIVDVCSGSGCIALALKKTFPTANVIGLEKSEDALRIANENKKQLALNVDFQSFDVLKDDWNTVPEMDVIVSNPPYIGYAEKENMPATVIEFEPEMALFVSDENPLIFYQKITEQAKNHLKPNGMLLFEINERYAQEVKTILHDANFSDVEILKDLQGKDRMVVGVKI
ncbi:MAG TPA: peptide chain release factor N(5)-glutamine methyltransferase [Crocinitomicaceae bacterium]|nr:peptide chain release factor N(5)-glutamine methyltransferase [Crocinitomicaceae bacterium]